MSIKILESKDPYRFHKYVKYKLQSRSCVGSLLDKNDNMISDTKMMVVLLNDFFVSTFTGIIMYYRCVLKENHGDFNV